MNAFKKTSAALLATLALTCAGNAAAAGPACDRACLSGLVDQTLASMVAHDPDTLPLATSYAATENSHAAALGMMNAWRTITRAGKPSLLAIDSGRGQAYFALPVAEAGGTTALWGRIKVEGRRISEVEIFLSRSRGDHGFSFGAEQMADKFTHLTRLPAARRKASHDELETLARAAFDPRVDMKIDLAADCQFTEVGSLVVDPGLDDEPARPGADKPLGCIMPPSRPVDLKARIVVVDDETGLVVVAGLVPGIVYPYPFRGHMLSAFIPADMKEPGLAQAAWVQRKVKQGKTGLLAPTPATGETMQVLQYYDGKLQGEQINVSVSGPGMQSAWVK